MSHASPNRPCRTTYRLRKNWLFLAERACLVGGTRRLDLPDLNRSGDSGCDAMRTDCRVNRTAAKLPDDRQRRVVWELSSLADAPAGVVCRPIANKRCRVVYEEGAERCQRAARHRRAPSGQWRAASTPIALLAGRCRDQCTRGMHPRKPWSQPRQGCMRARAADGMTIRPAFDPTTRPRSTAPRAPKVGRAHAPTAAARVRTLSVRVDCGEPTNTPRVERAMPDVCCCRWEMCCTVDVFAGWPGPGK